MNKLNYLLLAIFFIISSCSDKDDTNYVQIEQVSVDLTKVPYEKLSEYHFFVGELNKMNPTDRVIPYKPASELFSDYAHKKRFVWMPANVKASYDGDDNVLNFPVGTVLIKTFYYDNVQPENVTKIIETRLLVKKTDGWKAFDYIWNADQTDATLDVVGNGNFVPITWIENNTTKSTNYKIPSQTECVTCHKINPNQTGEITIPIGPKPQNLNYTYNYGTFSKNQLDHWISEGFIDNSLPERINIKSTIDWKDTSFSLELRARSYIDINCAHCHRNGGHCDYTPQRFNFSNTDMHTFGVCLTPLFAIPNKPFVINGGNADRSELIYRINTTIGSEMMPIIGRTLIHTQGVQLMTDWINSLPANCH